MSQSLELNDNILIPIVNELETNSHPCEGFAKYESYIANLYGYSQGYYPALLKILKKYQEIETLYKDYAYLAVKDAYDVEDTLEYLGMADTNVKNSYANSGVDTPKGYRGQ